VHEGISVSKVVEERVVEERRFSAAFDAGRDRALALRGVSKATTEAESRRCLTLIAALKGRSSTVAPASDLSGLA